MTATQPAIVILMLPSQRTGQIIDDYCAGHGVRFERTIRTSNMPAMIELVALGYGVAFVFEPHLRHQPPSRKVDCYSFGEPRTASHFVAACRKGSYLPQYARAFIDLARELYKN